MGFSGNSKYETGFVAHLRKGRRYFNIAWVAATACVLFWGMTPSETALTAKDPTKVSTPLPGQTSSKTANDRYNWDYSGENGPENWSLIDDSYSACGHNRKQSPLDIPQRQSIQNFPSMGHYGTPNMNFEDTSRTWALTPVEMTSITVAGVVYQLKSVQFRSPSEHTVHGFHYPLEIQLFHESANGRKLAMAVFASKSKNAFSLGFDAVISASTQTTAGRLPVAVAVDSFIPKSNRGWSYNGSMTTPPCEESVRWFVFSDTVAFSGAQLAAFRKSYPNNVRPIPQQSEWTFDVLNNATDLLSH